MIVECSAFILSCGLYCLYYLYCAIIPLAHNARIYYSTLLLATSNCLMNLFIYSITFDAFKKAVVDLFRKPSDGDTVATRRSSTTSTTTTTTTTQVLRRYPWRCQHRTNTYSVQHESDDVSRTWWRMKGHKVTGSHWILSTTEHAHRIDQSVMATCSTCNFRLRSFFQRDHRLAMMSGR